MALLDWLLSRKKPLTKMARAELRRQELLLEKDRNQLLGKVTKIARQKQELFDRGAQEKIPEVRRMLAQGRENQSAVVRRRLAAQLAQLRKDLVRLNTTASMLNQQINIISTDIHNLTLIQQGQMAALPSTEELTENAVRAEEMLETLKADAELVAGLETGLGEVLAGDDEKAILAEFDRPEGAAPATAAVSPTKTPTAARETPGETERILSEFDRPATPPEPQRKKTTDPEAS